MVKNLPANAGDVGDAGSVPRSGKSPGEGNGNPLQRSCLENPRDGGAWWIAVYGITQSRIVWVKEGHLTQLLWKPCLLAERSHR